jgi:hypothetical protein
MGKRTPQVRRAVIGAAGLLMMTPDASGAVASAATEGEAIRHYEEITRTVSFVGDMGNSHSCDIRMYSEVWEHTDGREGSGISDTTILDRGFPCTGQARLW